MSNNAVKLAFREFIWPSLPVFAPPDKLSSNEQMYVDSVGAYFADENSF